MFYLNIYDNSTGRAWQEVFEKWECFYKRYNKLRYSKKLFVLSHSPLN